MSASSKKKVEKKSELNLSLDDISSIITLLKENEVSEFSLERGENRLWLKREKKLVKVHTETPGYRVKYGEESCRSVATEEPVFLKQNQESSQTTETSQAETEQKVPMKAETHEVRSPMVGTFYRRPAADSDPYVEVGDLVKKGDVLCIIEAMKIMNEIETDVTGTVVEINVEDGQMAEYGEVLFRIDTGKK